MLEYEDLLTKANKETDTVKQMAYVAAWVVSPYAATDGRV